MRREDKMHDKENRKLLKKDRQFIEAERGWAGQHGQHPENEEEEKYRPLNHRPTSKDVAAGDHI